MRHIFIMVVVLAALAPSLAVAQQAGENIKEIGRAHV